MNTKERAKIRNAMRDAEEKLKSKDGKFSEDHYQGMADAFRWVLMEV